MQQYGFSLLNSTPQKPESEGGKKKAPLSVCVASSHLKEQNWEKHNSSLSLSLLCRNTDGKKQLSFSFLLHPHTHTHTHKQTNKQQQKTTNFFPFFFFLALVRDKPTILLQHAIQESNTILMIL
jgi:hypothetical protein